MTALPADGQAVAGRIASEDLLVHGVFSEGRVGDWILANDRVRFVVQDVRPGSFLAAPGGGVLDADVVRPDGHLGRDMVKDWAVSLGLARLLEPDTITVLADGSDGGEAVLEVRGRETALTFLEGNLEAPGFVTDLGLEATQTYRLAPGSWFLEVTTTVTAPEPVDALALGDLLMGAPEVGWAWTDGAGLGGIPAQFRWTTFVAHDHRQAVGVFAPPGEVLTAGSFALVAELTDLVAGAAPAEAVPAGGTLTFTRRFGVGPDLATLTDAWLADGGVATTRLEGTVTDGARPLEGVPVAVWVDDAPFTLARSGPDGAVGVDVPAGSDARWQALGRGTGRFLDLPEGWTPAGPYAPEAVLEATRAAYGAPAPAVPPAPVGHGLAPAEEPLTLAPRSQLVVDGGPRPFTVEVFPSGPAPERGDPRVVADGPSGRAAVGWGRGGPLALDLPEGAWRVLVHRGARAEPVVREVTTTATAATPLDVALEPVDCDTTGWVLGDPHSHAVSSADANIGMEERLIVQAAAGVDVHFGTDHDRLSDYAPLLPALGLDDVLHSVLALEFSPTTRGHVNVYPMVAREGPNLGAWSWWDEPALPPTDALLAELDAQFLEPVLQANHPTDGGVASAAGWSPGRLRRPDRWSERLDAVEVLNSGRTDTYLDFWLDITARGLRTTPVGVSDSHGHLRGHQGLSSTWIHLGPGQDTVGDLTDARIADALRAGEVVPTRGLFLDVDPLPGRDVAPGGTIRVRACGGTFARADRIRLLRDGVEVEVVEGPEATFTLSPDADAVYAIVAEGDTPMQPVDGNTPWALAGPYRVDVDGDGWTPPRAPLAAE